MKKTLLLSILAFMCVSVSGTARQKVETYNYPEGQTEMLDADNNLENPDLLKRQIPFGRELWVDGDDFMEVPVKKYFRLFPGNQGDDVGVGAKTGTFLFFFFESSAA